MRGTRPGQQVTGGRSDLPDGYMVAPLAEVDPEIYEVLGRELERQRNTLEMTASENFVPRAILRRLRRGGCRRAARHRRAKELFGG